MSYLACNNKFGWLVGIRNGKPSLRIIESPTQVALLKVCDTIGSAKIDPLHIAVFKAGGEEARIYKTGLVQIAVLEGKKLRWAAFQVKVAHHNR